MNGKELDRRIVRGTVHTAAGRVASLLIGLVLVPWILSTLGPARFGVWVIAVAVANHLGILTAGLRIGLTRTWAALVAAGRLEELGRTSGAFLLLSALLGLVSTALVALVAPWLARQLSLPGGELLLVAAAVGGAIRQPLGAWEPLLLGLQRFGWVSVLGGLRSLVWAALVAAVLLERPEPLALIAADGVLSLVMAVPGFVLLARALPPGARLAGRPDRPGVMELSRYAGKVLLMSLAGLFNRHSDGLLVGAWLAAPVVAAIEIAQQLAGQLNQVVIQLLSTVMPVGSELGERGDRAGIERVLFLGQRVVNLGGLAAYGLAFSAAPTILRAWLGPAQVTDDVVLATRALLTANGLLVLCAIAGELARGMNRLEVELRAAVWYCALALPLKLGLLAAWGLHGLLAAAVLLNGANVVYVLVALGAVVGYRVGPFLGRTLARPLVAVALACAAVIALERLAPAFDVPLLLGARTPALLRLAMDCAVFAVVLLAAALLCGALDREVRELLQLRGRKPE